MGQSWVETETAGCDLGDGRLNRRLGTMLEALGERPGKSLPTAFQDWSNTKAAYRFFSDGNVSEDRNPGGPFRRLCPAHRGNRRSHPDPSGYRGVLLQALGSGEGRIHEDVHRTQAEGRPLPEACCLRPPDACEPGDHAGRPAAWPDGGQVLVAHQLQGNRRAQARINPTRVPIDQKESMRWLDNLRLSSELAGAPERCVHVGDRESDIYELYCLAEELGTGFLVRSCVDRLAEDGGTTIAKVMSEVQSSGTHEVRFRDAQGNDHCAVLSVRHATMTVRPPIGKQGKYRHQELQIIHAEELDRRKAGRPSSGS